MSVPASIRPRHAVGQLKPGVAMPHRKNIRMQGWDFTSPGWYFITICVKNMKSVFGTVINGRMLLNEAGAIAEKFWREIPDHFPRASVDEHVVMPNHVHGLLNLTACREDTTCRAPLKFEAFGKPVAGSVPTIVRSFKGAVTRALGENVWQGRFYEVRARDDAARANIRRYIRDNPRNFDAVMNCGESKYLGNKALLDLPKLGFLASRGPAALHGNLPLKPGEAIMSGFLSPMERAVFRAGLDHKRPMIWVLPSGLGALNSHTIYRMAIEEGRLLVLSPFDPGLDAPNARRAAWCNQYVLTHSDRAVIGHLNPDGMLACILAEADPEKEIIRL